ncbi:MAG: SdpI family protein [Candidatus Limivicinus sp.]
MGYASNKAPAMTREQEILASRHFGHHVSKEKAAVLFAAALLFCACPILIGLRLYGQIPEIVETGLIGVDGRDDSLPRWALVFAIPGLMCVFTIICHVQLILNQRLLRVPSTPIRILGRWTIPVISLFFCSWAISSGAGETLSRRFYLSCVLASLLTLLGSHLYDCGKDKKLALRLKFTEASDRAWKGTHRLVGLCWMLAGLLIPVSLMLAGKMLPLPLCAVLGLIVLPLPFCALLYRKRF